MWLPFLRTLRHLLSVHRRDTTPRQLAAGLVCGIALGLVPKGNLSAVALTCLLFGLRANLGVGVIAAFLVSLAAPSFGVVLHSVGSTVLSVETVRRALGTLFRIPLVAWTRLDNTVVMGGVTVGLAQLGVSYCLSVRVFRLLQSKRSGEGATGEIEEGTADDRRDPDSSASKRKAA